MAPWCIVWLLAAAAPQESPEAERPAIESRVSQQTSARLPKSPRLRKSQKPEAAPALREADAN